MNKVIDDINVNMMRRGNHKKEFKETINMMDTCLNPRTTLGLTSQQKPPITIARKLL